LVARKFGAPKKNVYGTYIVASAGGFRERLLACFRDGEGRVGLCKTASFRPQRPSKGSPICRRLMSKAERAAASSGLRPSAIYSSPPIGVVRSGGLSRAADASRRAATRLPKAGGDRSGGSGSCAFVVDALAGPHVCSGTGSAECWSAHGIGLCIHPTVGFAIAPRATSASVLGPHLGTVFADRCLARARLPSCALLEASGAT